MCQLKALVEFSRNMLFPNIFRVKSDHKNPKNRVKRLFKGRLKNHVFDLKSVKNDRF
jgi:hypothetical protein